MKIKISFSQEQFNLIKKYSRLLYLQCCLAHVAGDIGKIKKIQFLNLI